MISDIDSRWQELCEQHDKARDAYNQAFAVVNQKFVAIGEGTATKNPSQAEADELDRTWSDWEDVKRRMQEFLRDNV